jgi:hypothetical protein
MEDEPPRQRLNAGGHTRNRDTFLFRASREMESVTFSLNGKCHLFL